MKKHNVFVWFSALYACFVTGTAQAQSPMGSANDLLPVATEQPSAPADEVLPTVMRFGIRLTEGQSLQQVTCWGVTRHSQNAVVVVNMTTQSTRYDVPTEVFEKNFAERRESDVTAYVEFLRIGGTLTPPTRPTGRLYGSTADCWQIVEPVLRGQRNLLQQPLGTPWEQGQ